MSTIAPVAPARLDRALLRCQNPACGARFDEVPLVQLQWFDSRQEVLINTDPEGIEDGDHDWAASDHSDGEGHGSAWCCGACREQLPEAQQVAIDVITRQERFALRQVSPPPEALVLRYLDRYAICCGGAVVEVGAEENRHQPVATYVIDLAASAWAKGAGMSQAQEDAFLAARRDVDLTEALTAALNLTGDDAERGLLDELLYTEPEVLLKLYRRDALTIAPKKLLFYLRGFAAAAYGVG